MTGRPRLFLALAACTVGAGGCVTAPQTVVLQRASNEFRCPDDQIAVLQRGDISASLYDVAACGHRARYSCFRVDQGSVGSMQCVREPDPPASDPDPVALAIVPRPRATARYAPNLLRICGREDGDCLARGEDGSWRWRPRRSEPEHCGGAPCL